MEVVPLLYHKKLGPDLQGFVGACYKEGGGNVFARRGGYFQHQGEAEEDFAQRNYEMGERVDREVLAHRWGGDRGAPVQREVVGGKPPREVPCGVKGSEGGE